jgi:hypothetical protein
MNLARLREVFRDQGADKIYVKRLAANDNSKNQVYLGGSFELLNIFPVSEVNAVSAGDWKRDRVSSDVNYSWITEEGGIEPAPNTKLILYPKYPEVRLSGFLKGCRNAPSELMRNRIENRLLFLADNGRGRMIGFVTAPDSGLADEFNNLGLEPEEGVFMILPVVDRESDSRQDLLREMLRIYNLGWINSKRLNSDGQILDCNAPNCGGYTLEAELGVTPNGYSAPDYLGWEIKQYGVTNFERISAKAITLMTPEPNGGFYRDQGVGEFIRRYGYPDKNGRPDRLNFGGVHRVGIQHSSTNLTLRLSGFDSETGKIRNAGGAIELVDQEEEVTASWSFASLLTHWNKKHNQACYIPSLSEMAPVRKYRYSNSILLGEGTDFQLFLKEMDEERIYYDPGIKMEGAGTEKPVIKRRSQFRIKSGDIRNLYHDSEFVNLEEL